MPFPQTLTFYTPTKAIGTLADTSDSTNSFRRHVVASLKETADVRRWLLMFFVGLTLLMVHPALASVDLPLHHWSYEAIERLTAMGVIDRAMVVPKPYSRKQAAKYVARAIERVRANQVEIDGQEKLAEPLLDRLIQFLRLELVELGAVAVKRDERIGATDATTQEIRPAIRLGGRLQVEGDAFSVGHGSVRLRENRMGQYYANGGQIQSDFRGWLEVSDYLALSIDPKYISNVHALGAGVNENNLNTYMQEFNAKLTLRNIAVQAGRGSLWWGPGYRGSLLLTDHAFPLDMVQVGSDELFRLPGILQSLGEWKVNSFLTRLEKARDFGRVNVFGLRTSYLPASWLELGLTRLTQFGGSGRHQSFPKAVWNTYTKSANQPGAQEVNEQVSVDFRATVPAVKYLVPFPAGMQLYGEIGSEDKWSQFPLPSRAAVLGGIYIPQVFQGDTMDFRVEYADTDWGRRRHPELTKVWYNNGIYTSGMRHQGFPLGHWVGADGTDIFVRSTRYLTDQLQVGTNFEFSERGRGQPVHEKKREIGTDLTWYLSSHVQFTLTYTYQRIQSPSQITSIKPFDETFSAGVTPSNHFVWTNLAVEF